MTINITVNGSLVLDETAGAQIGTDATAPTTDNDVALTYSGGTLSNTGVTGLDSEFLSYLNALFTPGAVEDAALGYAATVEGASSGDSFITVNPDAGETIDNLFFKVTGNGLISTVTTLANEALYFHVDPLNSDRAVLTTSETAGAGRIVAAFYLDEADDHLSAQVQMVTFEALRHTDGTNPDDPINFSDVLQVGATGSLSFDFDNLDSGNFLWVAIGTETAGLLVTGRDLNVQDSGSKLGQYIPGGNDDPSDSMNTSQGGAGATIGVNSQHFVAGGQPQNPTDGSTAVFTLVRAFQPLPTDAEATPTNQQATGTNVLDIDYGVAGAEPDYINTTGAGLFVSQLTGTSADMRVSLWTAGGAGGLTAEEGFAYIGDQATDSAFYDDIAVAVGTVTVTRGGVAYVFNATGTNNAIGVTVTFVNDAFDNTFTVTGLDALDTVSWTAAGGATFNRFQVTALSTTGAFDLGRVDILQGFDQSTGLGSHLFVDDDGPSFGTPGSEPDLTVDESAFDTNDSDSFAGAFTPNYGTDGQALASPITYALGIGNGATGLIDTLSGDTVVLSQVGGVVFGLAGVGGPEVFRVTVDSDGNVTLDQSRAVVHDDPADHDEDGAGEPSQLLSDALITLSATITDRDGDTATTSINIGRNLFFEDDGPTIARNATPAPVLTTDDTDIEDSDGPGDFGALFTPTFGADGFLDANDDDVEDANAVTFALSLKDGDGTISGLIDVESGDRILLRVVSGDIEGYLENTPAEVAFLIDLNQDTGAITLTQSRAIEHDDDQDPVESGASAAVMAADLIVLTATVRDGDNDSNTAPTNIGDAFRFEDDGPSITAPGTQPELEVDESDLGVDDTEDFSGAFLPDFGEDGEADSDATTYELGFNPGATGLVETASNEAVVLSKEGDAIVGRTEIGGVLVFQVSVDADGNVTLDQLRAVVHSPDSGPNQSTGLASADLITLTATITDGDGDQASATIDIADNLNFLDDAPAVTLSRDPAGFATVDESDLGTDAISQTVLLDPTIDYGEDGAAGSNSAVYSLDVVDTGPTNLETTAGDDISLVQISDTEVQGQYDVGQVAFVVLIDAVTGAVTLDQVVALKHPLNPNPDDSVFLDEGFLNAVLTVTDGDGDEASDPADIGPALEFKDDGPSVVANNVGVLVDDDGGATGNPDGPGDSDAPKVTSGTVVPVFDFGADGQGSYTITLANLVNPPSLTSQGGTVRFTQTANTLTAYVDVGTQGDGYQVSDREVFTFELDSQTGDFDFTLIDQIDHSEADTEDNLAIQIGVVLQAIDGDDDPSANAANIQLNIDFDDDSPVITSQISDGIVDGNVVGNSVSNSLNGAVGFDDNDANDETGAGVKTYSFDAFTTPTNAWPNLVGELSDDGATINYYDGVGGDLVYSIVLAQDGSGQYTFTVHKETTAQKLEFDFSDLPSGQNLFGVLVDREDGVLQVDGKGLLVVGRDAILNPNGSYPNTSDTINTSKGGGGVTIGVDNQMFDPGDGAVFVFLDNPDDRSIGGLNPGGLTQNTADDADTLGFEGTYNTRSAELEVVQKQGSTACGMKITAYNVDVPGPDDTIVSATNPLGADVNSEGRSFIDNPLAGGTIVSIDTVQVFDRANPSVLLLNVTINQATGQITNLTGPAAGYSASATQAANGAWTVTVTGFNANDSIVYTTVADHDAVLTEGTSGKWDLGGINLVENIDLPDQVFDFTVAINDYDGDSSTASFSIGVDGTGAADDGIVAGVDPLPVPIAPLAAFSLSAEYGAFGFSQDDLASFAQVHGSRMLAVVDQMRVSDGLKPHFEVGMFDPVDAAAIDATRLL